MALPGVTKAEIKFSSGRIEIEHDRRAQRRGRSGQFGRQGGLCRQASSILTVGRRSDRHASSLGAWRPHAPPPLPAVSLVSEGEILCFPG
ncbi:MAG: hypothetical protein WBA88_10130 [Pseudaminobacter sp.]